MKKFYVFLFAFFAINVANAQGCLPEGIKFETQAQIDNFKANHPGCTEIEGNVEIHDTGFGDISNLNGLSILNSIGGYLSIYGNTILTSLSGLNNLTFIGGSLGFQENSALTRAGKTDFHWW